MSERLQRIPLSLVVRPTASLLSFKLGMSGHLDQFSGIYLHESWLEFPFADNSPPIDSISGSFQTSLQLLLVLLTREAKIPV